MLYIQTNGKINYKYPEKYIWNEENELKMVLRKHENRRSTICKREFCQKAPLSARSFLGLIPLHLKFSKSTFLVKNYTNQQTKDLIYKKKCCLFNVLLCLSYYGVISEALYFHINIRLMGNPKYMSLPPLTNRKKCMPTIWIIVK